MPRQARLILDSAYYHVITRGNKKQTIFMDTLDHIRYIDILLRYKKRYRYKIYGWCLMNNHVHLVIESNKLSKLMHGINLSYAQYFQNKYKAIGHFWQDRYKSFVIGKGEYAINCINYIEYNPVRANIVIKPEDYPWSSYNDRILGKKNDLLDPVIL